MRDLVRYAFGFIVCGFVLAFASYWQHSHNGHWVSHATPQNSVAVVHGGEV